MYVSLLELLFKNQLYEEIVEFLLVDFANLEHALHTQQHEHGALTLSEFPAPHAGLLNWRKHSELIGLVNRLPLDTQVSLQVLQYTVESFFCCVQGFRFVLNMFINLVLIFVVLTSVKEQVELFANIINPSSKLIDKMVSVNICYALRVSTVVAKFPDLSLRCIFTPGIHKICRSRSCCVD